MVSIDTVIFDLGGVLIDWDPKALFRTEFADEESLEVFLAETDFWERNYEHDTGNDWQKHVDEIVVSHPHFAAIFASYEHRFQDALVGTIPGSLDVLAELHELPIRLLALTNFAAPRLDQTLPVFPWLEWFDEIVASGKEGFGKPDPRIYQVLIERLGVDPAKSVFIDDRIENVTSAIDAGFSAIHFTDSESLRDDLVVLGVLPG